MILKDLDFDISEYSDAFFVVTKNDKWAVMTRNKEIISDWQYFNFPYYSLPQDKIIAFRKNGKWGFIEYKNNKYTVTIKPKFEAAQSGFANGLAAVKIKNKWGYIDDKGIFVIKPIYKEANNFNDEFAVVECYDSHNSKILGVINKNGELIFKKEAYLIAPVSEGLMAFYDKDGKKIGFIDLKGKEMIPPIFYDNTTYDYPTLYQFNDGHCMIANSGGLYGIINKRGKNT